MVTPAEETLFATLGRAAGCIPRSGATLPDRVAVFLHDGEALVGGAVSGAVRGVVELLVFALWGAGRVALVALDLDGVFQGVAAGSGAAGATIGSGLAAGLGGRIQVAEAATFGGTG